VGERPVLFERFPQLESAIPWRSLGVCRTPLERVQLRLDDGSIREILVKRDDLTATPYGGNKVRKLEFILADAEARGATRVITAGAAGSHHALATTLYARQLGMDVTLVLFPQSRTPHVREVLLLDHALGAELRFTARMESVPIALMRARVSHRRQKPYLIAPGGSDPIGTLGYVSAGLELDDQIGAGGLPRVERIHAAAGTLGTVAGLALGLAIAGRDIAIAATRITSRIVCNEVALGRLIERTASVLRRAGLAEVPVDRAKAMIELRHDQIGAGYGRETEPGRAATRIFGEAGLVLDATYTAKAAADLLESAVSQAALPLFLHTLSAAEPVERARGTTPADLPEPFRRYLEA
jgi:1-aminocyclopropane-1-carboxylate deaminase/D-cysteine desulfhydrase-like pyridoxal-dependent ACC family enzyme